MAGADLDALPNVEFGVIGFANWARITDFTSDWSVASAALGPASGQGGPATDYQGALSTVLRVLEQDMVAAGAAVRARTRYIVLFLSDGIPEPRCRAGCGDGGSPPDSLYGVCNYTGNISDGYYVDMLNQCPDYNQPIQILRKVQDILAMGDLYGVGDIRMHTVLLFAPEEVVIALCGDAAANFGYVREEAEPLLRSMAAEGQGTFRDVNISTEIDFLDFDYESLVAPYEMMDFFALNMSALSFEQGVLADSDGDGLDDSQEFDWGLDRLARDTDGDLFSDFFEVTFAHQGFDALDPEVPAIGCIGGQDRDGDGLLECEEIFLGPTPSCLTATATASWMVSSCVWALTPLFTTPWWTTTSMAACRVSRSRAAVTPSIWMARTCSCTRCATASPRALWTLTIFAVMTSRWMALPWCPRCPTPGSHSARASTGY